MNNWVLAESTDRKVQLVQRGAWYVVRRRETVSAYAKWVDADKSRKRLWMELSMFRMCGSCRATADVC
jgi:hypothetical protein